MIRDPISTPPTRNFIDFNRNRTVVLVIVDDLVAAPVEDDVLRASRIGGVVGTSLDKLDQLGIRCLVVRRGGRVGQARGGGGPRRGGGGGFCGGEGLVGVDEDLELDVWPGTDPGFVAWRGGEALSHETGFVEC